MQLSAPEVVDAECVSPSMAPPPHPEWSLVEIKALREALSEEDMAQLQEMRSSQAQLQLDVSMDEFVKQKMKEYRIQGVTTSP